MSVILKGIDMPKCSNEDIMVVIRRDKAEVWQTGYKERTVEAIQIPTPHGRLIDEEKILSPIMCKPKSLRLDDNAQYNIITLIANAPTILEEEKQ